MKLGPHLKHVEEELRPQLEQQLKAEYDEALRVMVDEAHESIRQLFVDVSEHLQCRVPEMVRTEVARLLEKKDG